MRFKRLKYISIVFGVLVTLLLAACSDSEDGAANDKEEASDGDTNDNMNTSEEIDYTIVGIEPGAGVSVATETAIQEYDSLQGWNIELSSTGAMMTELDNAIRNEEPIIVTGWSPHWMFAAHPGMKYLEDPKEIYGGEEVIHSMSRLGFEEDHPEAHQIISQFEWDVEDMEGIMYEAEESGRDIYEIAVEWVDENEEITSAWVEGVDDVDGEEIELVSTVWDTERASSSVLAEVLERNGFDVTVTDVDAAIVFESLATGDADATIAPWLPVTHGEFLEKYQDDIEDLGVNLVGAKIGLVVPEYVDFESIEDLEPR